MTLRPRTAAVLLATAAAAVVPAVSPALAATRAVASADLPAASGRWGAAVTSAGATPATGTAHTIAWVPPLTALYLDVVNTGTLALTGTTWTATNTKPTNGTAPPEIAFDACVGASWSALLGTCAGTVVRIGATSGGTLTVATTTTATAPGGRLSVRAVPTSLLNFPQSFSTTVGLSVARSQARAATTRTS